MAITNGYCTLAEYKQRFNIQGTDANRDADLEIIIQDVSRTIDEWCRTRFYTTGTDETRYFTAEIPCRVRTTPPLVSVTTLALDYDGDGVYEVEVDSAYYFLGPLNEEPYTVIELRANCPYWMPVGVPRGVKIVGKFGWTTAPGYVREACLIQSNRIYQRRSAPFGVTAPNEFGQQTVVNALDADVVSMLPRPGVL